MGKELTYINFYYLSFNCITSKTFISDEFGEL